MLKLKETFDLHRDVVSDVLRKEASVCRVEEYSGAVDARILNIESDGGILYSWKGATATTRIGKYDSNTKQNKLLYSFDKQVCVSSCSLNKEETLLAVSLAQNTRGEERLRPISKCLTLLIEIHPINNTKVLKAVDCRVKVQFLHQDTGRRSVLESHLLLLTEDGYVDLYHVLLTKYEGYRVVMANPDRLSKTVERIVEDLSWVQWDGHTQRLYYLTHKDEFLLRCVQFYPNHNCETVMELPLELPDNPFHTVKFVSLGFDHYHTERAEPELISMNVFTNRIGSVCVCYSQPLKDKQELMYTMVLVHKDCSKTFRVSLGGEQSQQKAKELHPLFIPMGYYILVYLQDHFLHYINTRQEEMLCHSLFLSGHDVDLGMQCHPADVTVLHAEEESCGSLLDVASGKIHAAELSPAYLLQILRSHTSFRCPSAGPPQHLAALHCLLVYMGNDPNLELKIIEWLCDNVSAFEAFDQIQEFILASLYRISYEKSLSLDKVLPYSSVFDKKEVPVCLLEIPGVLCTTELHIEAVLKGKGFWTELQWNTERTKYLHAVPNPRYRTSHIQADWDKLKSERRPSSHMNHIEENTKKVLSMVDTWCLDKKLVPLFQEEDHQQRVLIGLTVDKLREHLNRHLPRLGKKKADSLVVCYVAKLLELIRHMLESVWLKYKLGPRALCLKQQGSQAEWSVFHFMFRVLEATRGLCLPLPPGYHTLLAVFAVRCLPHQTFLQYIDHGFLQLTETFLSRLMTDLDNSDANERLKFSILKRLPQPMKQRIYHMWDHPVSSASISREYVRTQLEKRYKNKGFASTSRDKPGFRPDFLPLTYLAKILADIEEQALNPFEEQENVDASFVEETALKQTLILLGFEEK
ncbi:putative gamma-secretase-activating protein [Scophthalmus maximus]|uniref:Putative gamma-secretase-activating protein n=1 Tax=Scophthalmus maximus TaxID=52904 RepID=A0A2U9B2F2_SCOMX|nr:gamma-secretase-activating protein isoform X2 [Scophthalmus maximus]AWO98015.1 putative gamma-secretase-activating protein [Scophthalmus maximus]